MGQTKALNAQGAPRAEISLPAGFVVDENIAPWLWKSVSIQLEQGEQSASVPEPQK